jgi:hypothetical protein
MFCQTQIFDIRSERHSENTTNIFSWMTRVMQDSPLNFN